MTTLRSIGVGVVAVVVACRMDAGGPVKPVEVGRTELHSADVAGTWAATWTDLVGEGLSCRVTGMVLVFTQLSDTVRGQSLDGELWCNGLSGGPVVGTIASGRVVGDTVRFEVSTGLRPIDLRQAGTVNGAIMSGVATAEVVVGQDVGPSGKRVVVSGTWSAVRR